MIRQEYLSSALAKTNGLTILLDLENGWLRRFPVHFVVLGLIIGIDRSEFHFATNVQVDWGQRSNDRRHSNLDNIENLRLPLHVDEYVTVARAIGFNRQLLLELIDGHR